MATEIPFKSIDFRDLLRREIPDPIYPVAVAIPASPPPGNGNKSKWVIYLCLILLAIRVAVRANHFLNKQVVFLFQLLQEAKELKELNLKKKEDLTTDSITDSKTTDHEKTT